MPSRDHRSTLVTKSNLLLCALCVSAVSVSLAGPLTPPVGPIAPTPGPEPRIAINATNTPGDADSVFKITQRGSYYLTGNVTGEAGKSGIEITVTGVTLDLNGFDLVGVAGSLDGVLATAPGATGGTAVSVRNGTIRSWGDCGIEFPNIIGDVAIGVVENIHARGNARHGIALSGGGSILTRCIARLNGTDGINATSSITITECKANSNGRHGISANHSCNLSHCTSSGNTDAGFDLNAGCSLTACTAGFNLNGFDGLGGCSYINCIAYNNNGTGFVVSEGSIVTSCVAYFNTIDGFDASESTIRDCTAAVNTANGIRAGSDCILNGNNCDQNGAGAGDGAGILVTGNDCLVEGNRCGESDRGIEVSGAGNFIARNVCTGNTTNWDIAAGNKCFVVLGVDSAAIIGDSGGVSPGSTNPNANYTY